MRKYWCRKPDPEDLNLVSHIIKVEDTASQVEWIRLNEGGLYDTGERTTLEDFIHRITSYNQLYFPITRKQYLLTKISGVFHED
jgi:hypothetical protein